MSIGIERKIGFVGGVSACFVVRWTVLGRFSMWETSYVYFVYGWVMETIFLFRIGFLNCSLWFCCLVVINSGVFL